MGDGDGDGEAEAAFWVRHARIGVSLSLATTFACGLYLLLTWDRPHRPAAAIVVGLGAALALAVRLLPLRALLRRPRGRWVFYGWSAACVLFVTAGSLLDGGPVSPLGLIYVLALVYGSIAYPPRGMFVLGGSIVALVVVTGLVSSVDPGTVAFIAATYALITTMCALIARNVRLQQREQEALALRLGELAHVDGLTGCLNHRAFHERLRTEAARAGRSGAPLSLLLADLDHFKSVNDTHGHLVGDALLARTGALLRECARAGDVVARVGGEEFALLLPGTGSTEAAGVAERVRRRLKALEDPVTVTVSLGVAGAPGGAPLEALLRDADQALYAAKRAGRDRVAVAGVAGVG